MSNDLVLAAGPTLRASAEAGDAPDVWAVATWGAEPDFGDPQILIIVIGDDYEEGYEYGDETWSAIDYTLYNYIIGDPAFYYEVILEAYDAQVEGERAILDEGTDMEREASRGELFYPGDHGIEPTASRTIRHLCDVR